MIEVLFASALLAQQHVSCPPRAIVESTIENRYEEQRVATGRTTTGALMEIFVSEEKGTWTIVTLINVGTEACVNMSGRDWRLWHGNQSTRGTSWSETRRK
jgi:hypothetical protein